MYIQNNINFKILEHIGTVRVRPSGWATELIIVRWNGDLGNNILRTWSPDHTRCEKGVRLSEEDLFILTQLLQKRISEIT